MNPIFGVIPACLGGLVSRQRQIPIIPEGYAATLLLWLSLAFFAHAADLVRDSQVSSPTPPSGVSVSGLRCEFRVNPLGIDASRPRLSWVMEAKGHGARQTAYQVLIADGWDSGKITSDQSQNLEYGGKPLASGTRYHWKVRVWDAAGKVSEWSEPATWTMGLLKPEDWAARWISTEMKAPADSPTMPEAAAIRPEPLDSPYVRRTFDLATVPTSAMATVNVIGFYELYVNGKKVGPNVMGPALTNYANRSLYETYDLAPYLRKGRNSIGLWLSRGWYWKMIKKKRNPAVRHDTAIARMQLDMVVACRPMQIITDDAWRCKSSGRSLLGTWSWGDMGGELVDARKADPRWADPDIDDRSWYPVSEVPAPAIPADAQECPPMRVLKTIPAIACAKLPQGKYQLDFGTQLTGWLKLRLRGQKAGDTITISYADKLQPMQTFKQIDRFICAGGTEEEFCSKFNYHGFRWAIIEGLAEEPQLADAEAEMIGADFETRGGFECSSDQLNRMHAVNLWTIRCLSQSGFLSDCPHRERLGYGDGQVSIESCVMNFGMQPFYDKWSTDWVDGANPKTGYLPHTAPQGYGGGGPAWGGAGQALTWRNYLYYNDTRIVERNLEACSRHIKAIEARAKDGVVRAFGGKWDFIGDWVPPERGMDTKNWPPQPAAELFNNCYRLYLREQWAQMADALGRHDEAKASRAEAERLRPLVHAAFYDKEKQLYVLDEQAYYLMPLMTGVVPEELRPTLLKKLEECIRVTRKGHLDTGMLGTYFLLNYLMEIGRSDLVHLMVTQKEYPGWGYMLEQGATTWWEQWNGYYSQIHSCFASLDGWFSQGLAGIRADPAAPGFKHILIKPAVVGDLTWVKCHHDSAYGRIVSNWKKVGDKLTMQVTIPANTTATVFVPARDAASVTESGKATALAKGVKFQRMEKDAAVYEVGSGSYQFEAPCP
jgi:alpha-L-rhamnosidase